MRGKQASIFDSLIAAGDSRFAFRYPEIPLKRLVSLLRRRRHDVRLRTRFIEILLFSSVLAAIGIQLGVPKVAPLEWGISAGVVVILVCLVIREVTSRIKGNVFSEPLARRSVYLWVLLFLVAYVAEPRLEEHLIGNPLVQLATITLVTSFFLSAVVALGWLAVYERRNGPVYVVRA